MTNTRRDNNQIPALLATSNTDGTTPILLKANASTHVLKADDATSGSDLSGDDAYRDDNGNPVMLAVSELDGVTPTPIYANSSTGALLIDHV